jgi:protein-disulfide isomerase
MSKRGSRARQRKEAREAQQQKQRQTTIIAVVVVVAIVAAILFFISSQPTEAPVPDGLIDRYENYITGTNEDGFPQIGNPNAPIEVVEFSSFSCPACEVFHSSTFPNLLPYIESGEIRFVYVPLQTGGVGNAEAAARASVCALRQDKFWEMHDLLFNWHTVFGNGAFNSSRLTAGVEALNMDVGQFNTCFNSGETGDLLNLAQRQGVGATPTVRVNGNTLTDANLAEIEAAIAQFTLPDNLEPGVITEEGAADVDDDETDTTEPTNEQADDQPADTEATEEAETTDEAEATQEATDEVTEETEATEATEEASDDTTGDSTESDTDDTEDDS